LINMLKRPRRRAAAAPDTCEHLRAVADSAEPPPLSPGRCQECTDDGQDAWAHLRMCLSCGHVGCCDSSPHQHATEHFRQTGHPVMRSVEPGESWQWCYVDSRIG
jgi:uncharacterized UBP type Zn finger protein